MKQAHRLFGDEHQAYINGYNDNTFRPNNLITRAEVAALISRISPKYNTYRYYSSNFNDVHRGQWYYDSVAFMEYEQYISGYEDNSFRPNNPITRAEFSVIVCKANNIKATSARNNFEDVKGHWAEGYITALNRRKYINGYPNGEFQPDSPITRAEVVTVLNKVLNREPNKDRMDEEVIINPFKDLPRHHWAYYDILEASETHYEKEWH